MKFIKNLFIALFFTTLFSFKVSADYGIYYCPDMAGGECDSPTLDFSEYVTGVAGNVGVYNEYSVSSEDFDGETYLVYGTPAIDFYISEYALMSLVETDDYQYISTDDPNYFTQSEWYVYDTDKNMVFDQVDEYIEYLLDEVDRFEEDYDLDLWWENGDELPVFFVYGDLYADGILGLYSSSTESGLLMIDIYYTEEEVMSTITHELFHGAQHSYAPNMGYLPLSFTEATAVTMMSVANKLDATYLDVIGGAYQLDSPEYSLFGDFYLDFYDETDPYYDEYLQGATYQGYLWYTYLHGEYGKSIMVNMLESFADLFDDINSYDEDYFGYLALANAIEKEGGSIEEAYLDFSIQLLDADDFVDGEYLESNDCDEDYCDGVKIEVEHDDLSDSYTVSDNAPALYGSNYIVFSDIQDNNEESLIVDFYGNNDAGYHVSFVPFVTQDFLSSSVESYYVEIGEGASFSFPLLDKYKKVVMVVSPMMIDDFNTDDIFLDYVYPYSYDYEYGDYFESTSISYESDDEEIFTDVDSSHEYSTAIQYLKDNEIVGGYPDGSFLPEGSLNRAELLKILVEGAGYSPDSAIYSNCFSDVSVDWYAKYVCFAKEKGWVEGYPDDTFKPAQNVNKVEAIKMLLEVFAVAVQDYQDIDLNDVVSSEWYAKYIYTAYQMGVLEESSGSYYPGDDITRGQISENIYRLLIQ